MPDLTFRLKLFLAMMLVVAGVTGTTLYITQENVRATFQKDFEERFDDQIRSFAMLQEARLGAVRDKCRSIANSALSVRLRAAVEEEDADLLYTVAFDELRELYQSGEPSATNRSKLKVSFLRFLNAKGEVIQPPDDRAGLTAANEKTHLEAQLAAITKALKGEAEQQVGYLALEMVPDRSHLQEVIFTRIIEFNSRQILGAMILGLQLEGIGEREAGKAGRIKIGIWLDNRIYSQAIPNHLLASLAKRLAPVMKQATMGGEQVNVQIEDQLHRVFFQALNRESIFATAYQVCFYSLSDLFKQQRDLRWKILGFGTVALAGALAISLLLSHGLTGPIDELVAGTAEIQKGNYQIKVPVRSRDEIGRLAGSFNEMAEGLALKEKYRSVLNVVSDPKVAEHLMKGDLKLGGEKREVSVLFCDIRGFTKLTQNMPPDEVITMLNEHFTPLSRVVTEHDGVVDKFVGDLIMAVFGAPLSHGNDACQAARCALRMIEERAQLNQTSHHKIKMGIGVATGPAVAGCMGSEGRLNYTVLGERVNLGSRLCSKADPMQVVIDQTTRDRLGDSAIVEALPPLELKGFSDRITAYYLLEIKSPSKPV